MSPQKQRIVDMLRDAGGLGVCGSTFLMAYLPTYSQRIGELRRDGWQITSARCKVHPHKRSGISRYVLVMEPNERPRQRPGAPYA